MPVKKGTKYGRRARRIPKGKRDMWGLVPNKMLNDQKEEKASEKIRKKEEEKLHRKVLQERYGIC